ncbi:MAG TPA: hypothetical protein VMU33_06855 [Burkholderiaceae bacterium]|nr:hypothetical protein [Burkholderiaceae bacterium]
MNELFATLMSWAVTLSGLPPPVQLPEVLRVPHEELERLACDGRTCNVLGWHPPGNTVYLDNRLDLTSDIYADSILVHEMVHYLQEKSGAFQTDCRGYLGAERQAYAVQREFLVRYGDWRPAGGSIHGTGCQG